MCPNTGNRRKHRITAEDNTSDICTLSEIVNTTQDVQDILETLDTSKATGPDSINPTLLKQAWLTIVEPLCKFYNLSLHNWLVPSQWKIANVIPVFKKGAKNVVSNYRPISLLSVLGKCMEKCIFKY